jgi:hypothetical protein
LKAVNLFLYSASSRNQYVLRNQITVSAFISLFSCPKSIKMLNRFSLVPLLLIASVTGTTQPDDLPTLVHNQVNFLKQMIDKQEKVNLLFSHIESELPIVSEAPVPKSKRRIRGNSDANKAEHRKEIVDPADAIRAQLITEKGKLSGRPNRLACFRRDVLGAIKEEGYTSGDGIPFLKVARSVNSFINERITASSSLLKLIPSIPDSSGKTREGLVTSVKAYLDDAKAELAQANELSNKLKAAVEKLIRDDAAAKEQAAKAQEIAQEATEEEARQHAIKAQQEREELDQILNSFEVIDTESEFAEVLVDQVYDEGFVLCNVTQGSDSPL